jgi:hypothetical protein
VFLNDPGMRTAFGLNQLGALHVVVRVPTGATSPTQGAVITPCWMMTNITHAKFTSLCCQLTQAANGICVLMNDMPLGVLDNPQRFAREVLHQVTCAAQLRLLRDAPQLYPSKPRLQAVRVAGHLVEPYATRVFTAMASALISCRMGMY